MQWLNVTGANWSFVPALSTSSGLPLVHHLGDCTIRTRKADTDTKAATAGWTFYSSAWGPYSATATAVASKDPSVVASHDITKLLAATDLPSNPEGEAIPVKVVRSYSTPKAGPGLEVAFAVTNVSPHAVEIGAFGMSTPGGSDAHMGMQGRGRTIIIIKNYGWPSIM